MHPVRNSRTGDLSVSSTVDYATADGTAQAEQTEEDQKLYAEAEDEARAARRGLWVDANPIPPWDFRRGLSALQVKTIHPQITLITQRGLAATK